MNIDEQLEGILLKAFDKGYEASRNVVGLADEHFIKHQEVMIDEAKSALKKLINDARIEELYRLGMIGGVNIEVNDYLENRINSLKESKDIRT